MAEDEKKDERRQTRTRSPQVLSEEDTSSRRLRGGAHPHAARGGRGRG